MTFEVWESAETHPERLGLEITAVLNEPGLSWEYNTVLLFRRLEDGKLFWAADSGCSCPTPFEGYKTVESLNPLPETASTLHDHTLQTSYRGGFMFPDAATFLRKAGI